MVDQNTRDEVEREERIKRAQLDPARRKRLGELRAQAKAESAKRGPMDKHDTPPDIDDEGNMTEAGRLRGVYMGDDYQKHMEEIDKEYEEHLKKKKKQRRIQAAYSTQGE